MNKLRSLSAINTKLLYLRCLNCEKNYKVTVTKNCTNVYFNYANLKLFSTQKKTKIKCDVSDENEMNDNKNQDKLKKTTPVVHKTRKPIVNESTINAYVSSKKLQYLKSTIIPALDDKYGYTYLFDERVAEDVAKVVYPELKDKKKTFIMECNPGLGFLTSALLKYNLPTLNLKESSPVFSNYLKSKFSSKNVKIQETDVLVFSKMQWFDSKDDGRRIHQLLYNVPKRSWDDEPAIAIIATLANKQFILDVINCIITQSGFAIVGRPELFLIVESVIYKELTSRGDFGKRYYKAYTILFQILFEHKLLLKVPKKAFYPEPHKRIFTKFHKEFAVTEGQYMYVIKCTPRKDLYKNSLEKQLPLFKHFLKQLLQTCNNRIIPFLERWVPGCGILLIKKGYDVYTENIDISPNEFLDLFLEFIANEDSQFYASWEALSSIKKNEDDVHIEESDRDDDDDDEEEDEDGEEEEEDE